MVCLIKYKLPLGFKPIMIDATNNSIIAYNDDDIEPIFIRYYSQKFIINYTSITNSSITKVLSLLIFDKTTDSSSLLRGRLSFPFFTRLMPLNKYKQKWLDLHRQCSLTPLYA